MPCRPSAKSLKQCCLDSVATNLELLCYGEKKGSKTLAKIIESDDYKRYDSPFSDFPAPLLKDLNVTVYNRRSGFKHLLYQVWY